MALRKKVSKDSWEKLADPLKELYSEKDGEYVLDLEGEEDTGALLRAKEHEKKKAQEAKKKAKELEEELGKYKEAEANKEEELAKKSGDLSSLEKKWTKKHEDAIKAKDSQIETLTSKLTGVVVDSLATSIATEISTVPDLMIDIIKKRLILDIESDIPSPKVLDKNGELSPLTVEELKSEFRENEKYSSIIIGSKASGGAKDTSTSPIASPGASGSESKPDLMKMSVDQFKARLDAKRTTRED